MRRLPQISIRTDTLFPSTTLFRSVQHVLRCAEERLVCLSTADQDDVLVGEPEAAHLTTLPPHTIKELDRVHPHLGQVAGPAQERGQLRRDRKSTRLNSSH